jgi:hypothetical protein
MASPRCRLTGCEQNRRLMAAEGIEDLTSGNEKPKRAKQWPQKKKFAACRQTMTQARSSLLARVRRKTQDRAQALRTWHEKENCAEIRRTRSASLARRLRVGSTRSLPREHRRRPGARIINGAWPPIAAHGKEKWWPAVAAKNRTRWLTPKKKSAEPERNQEGYSRGPRLCSHRHWVPRTSENQRGRTCEQHNQEANKFSIEFTTNFSSEIQMSSSFLSYLIIGISNFRSWLTDLD